MNTITKLLNSFDLTQYELLITPYYLEDGKMIRVTNQREVMEEELFYKRTDIVSKLRELLISDN